ncbi:hypothetical protein [Pseudomonas sp. MB-090624]|uniref:hypothetical protein n=1 Tax=Pseudomonas sp. MB-090624 TaxID=2213078 RepID=UPI000D9331BF|nr:hypothetical protein [Pseudomonas sp. MB-090624]PYB88884.1 hypothetical protein DMX12_28535 [Pseudomonas sp. MB-090624]
MIKIRALRQFSHYHGGNFDQHEERQVEDSVAEALVGMELAEYVDGPPPAKEENQAKAGRKK